MALVVAGTISREEALQASSSPHELALRLGGVQSSSDQTWSRFENATAKFAAKGPRL